MRMAGTVIVKAADELIERGKQLAAFVLEAAESDIEFSGGAFSITGTDRRIGLFELAELLDARYDVPEALALVYSSSSPIGP